MYYEINVAKNGRHFFATAERSITDKQKLKMAIKIFKEKFPLSEGYEISAMENPQVYRGVNIDEIE